MAAQCVSSSVAFSTSAFVAGSAVTSVRIRAQTPVGIPALIQANANKKPFAKDGKSSAKGAQLLVGYKGSNQKGSAPGKDGKPGRVFRLSGENVDEYSPIFDPTAWSKTGDTYAYGAPGLLLWAVTLGALLTVGVGAIYFTSSLA